RPRPRRIGRARRRRAPPARPALRRHAPARRAGPGARARAPDPPDGRAVRRARRADQDRHAGGAGAHLRPHAQDGDLRHARHRGSHPPRRRGGGDERAPGAHQGGAVRRPAAAALARDGEHAGLCRDLRPGIPPDPRGSDDVDGAAGGCPGCRMTLAERTLPGIVVVAFLLAWEALVRVRGIAPIYLPAPSAVAVYLWRMIADGSLAVNLGITLGRVLGGFAIAAVAGVGLGVLMGMSRLVARIADPWIAALYPLPKIALIPLLLTWLGTGEAYKIVISAVTAFFPIVISAYAGIREVDRGLMKAAEDLGASRRQVQLKVVLPAAVPSIFAGLHLGMGVTIILVIAAEMIGGSSTSGMGYLLMQAGQVMETEKVFADLVVLAVVGALIVKLQRWIDRKVAPWAN